MSAPPKARGMIFADLHNHICTHLHPLESIADKLASGKITGLSEREDLGHIFTYDSALELLPSIGAKVEEVDSGLFAVIEWKGQKGYIARTKEFTYDHHHLLSLGVKDLNDDHDAEYTIKAIQDKGGVAILDHPYVLIPRRSEKFRFVVPGSADESGLDKFFEIVDEAEVFNASARNLFFIHPEIKNANIYALKKAMEHDMKGVAGSDTHYFLSQVHKAGFYVPESSASNVDALSETIRSHSFSGRYEAYVNRLDFVLSQGISMLFWKSNP